MQLLYVHQGRADRWLLRALQQMGHVVETARPEEGLAAAAEEDGCDLVLLEMARPDPARSGDLLEGGVPVMVLAEAAEAGERAAILRAGADACLVRPLHLIEVESRLMALVRMSDRARSSPATRAGLVFDRHERSLTLGPGRAELSAQEFRLVAYLFRREGQVIAVERLDRHLHGEAAEPRPDLIRAMAQRLRRRLRERLGAELIHHVRGHGYVLRLDGGD